MISAATEGSLPAGSTGAASCEIYFLTSPQQCRNGRYLLPHLGTCSVSCSAAYDDIPVPVERTLSWLTLKAGLLTLKVERNPKLYYSVLGVFDQPVRPVRECAYDAEQLVNNKGSPLGSPCSTPTAYTIVRKAERPYKGVGPGLCRSWQNQDDQ